MMNRLTTSRRRYRQYKEDLAAFRTEGSSRTGAAHARIKRRRGRHRSFFELLRSFIGLIRGHRMTMTLTLGLLSLGTLLTLVPPYAMKIVFDFILGDEALPAALVERFPIATEPRPMLTIVALTVIGISLLALAANMWSRWMATRITKRVQASVRKRVFSHAIRLPLNRVQQLKSGGVASILREDAGGIAELIFGMLYNPWKAVITLFGCLAVLAYIDWRLLLGSLLLLPIIFITHRTWISRIRPVWRDIRASRQDIDGQATESFSGMRVVRTFGRQSSETNRFIRNNHLMIRQEILAWWWSRAVDIAWSVIIPLASAALLWYGGRRVLDGAITVGDLVTFLAYLAMLMNPLAMLATSATQFQNSLAALDRVLDLLDEPREMPAREGAIAILPHQVQGRITFENVAFSYPGNDEIVLSGVTLDIEPGSMIALVGPSGAGKTTFCNLVARFYDPTEGVVRLDGRDLRDIEVESYRRLLGIVEQDIFLFDGTIAENIGYGRRSATREQIIEAARQANADRFITTFDNGYDTIIGERGVRLSGGQRQRLAIARAMLADPRILILDEATSNLDTESERLIQQSLRTLMAGRTSFVIAHRLSTIAHADRIVVLEDGRIIEEGTHETLMSRSSRYRRMVRLQTNQALGVRDDGNGSPLRSPDKAQIGSDVEWT